MARKTSPSCYDLLIVGAGPAGAGLAAALNGTGLRILMIDAQDEASLAAPELDGRDIALTHASEKILKELDAWPEADAAPIRRAEVRNGTQAYPLSFDAETAGVAYLGHLVPHACLRQSLFARARANPACTLRASTTLTNLTHTPQGWQVELSQGPTVTARLVVAADGRFSTTRAKVGVPVRLHDYRKTAILCRFRHTQDHNAIASETFGFDETTLALLPLAGRECSAVITLPPLRAAALMDASPEALTAFVEHHAQMRLGRMTLSSPVFHYPLVGTCATRFIDRHFALLGDAAVGMHPVTAHGFNLALGGLALLAEEIRTALDQGRDGADSQTLEAYQTRQRRAALPLYYGTDTLVRLYTNENPVARVLRWGLLRAGNALRFANRQIIAQLTKAG